MVVLLLACVLLGAALPADAQDAAVALPRLALEDSGSGETIGLLDEARALRLSLAVRVVLPSMVPSDALDTRLAAFATRGAPVWLSIPAPSTEADAEGAWREAVRQLIDRRGSTLAVLEVVVDGVSTRVASFAVQVAATEARARREQVRVAIGGAAMHDGPRRSEIYTAELAPYVDLLSLPGDRAAGAAAWLARVDPDARIILAESGPSTSSEDPGRIVVDGIVQDLGTAVVVHAWRSGDVTPGALRALSPVADLLSHEISVLDADAVGLTLMVASQDVSLSLPHRLLFDTDTFSTLLVYWGTPAPARLSISLRVPIEGVPAVIDLLGGARSLAEGYRREPGSEQTTATAPMTGRPMIVDFNEGATALADGTTVSAERQLTVGEIISRQQQQQLAQDRLVRHYTADARMRQSFRPTLTDPGYDVVTGNRYFVEGSRIEWEELSFAVNNRTWERDRPPYPLLQPEKVFSFPLQLRFDEGYTYRLSGAERVDGFDCYKVSFEPARDDSALYKGTVWIDRRTFARIKVHAVRGGLPGMVVSNDETLHYAPVAAIGGRPVFLFSGMEGRQIVLLAGRNITLEKSVTFTGFRVNGDGFEEARATAHRSDRIMYRETPGGLRYLVTRDGERVVSDRPTERVKALAIGAVVDPSYAFPLPIVGINYVDFSFGNPDTQLAMLFAGVLAAGNIQRPQLGSARLDASVDFFAIAAPSSDRVYRDDGEIESERVLTWPMSTGLNLGWQATAFQKLTLQYQFRFDAYVRDTTTAETFPLPSSTITNGIGGAWEYSRGGYTAVLNATWFARGRWGAWGTSGPGGDPQRTARRYAKYTASLSRDVFIGALQKVNVNGAWFGGRDLDRFVKYQFGMFDATRVHGVPAAVRFGELAMARGAYSLNVLDQYRLDLFLDHAWGQDDEGGEWQRVPGIGAAFNLPGPWNTIVRADVGKSWLPARYGSLGSTTAQIMLLKPLK